MQITDELIYAYKNLVDKIYLDKNSYKEEELTLFTSGIGKEYDKTLMIIGRAVNGWRIYLNKIDDQYKTSSLESVKKRFGTDDLQWVIDCWGNNEESYNTRKSAFWRLSKRLSDELIENNDLVINKIVWSNLYKISKDSGGNPSGPLKKVQFEECKKILKLEIELFKPKIAIFLTSYNWSKWFLDDSDYKKIDIKTPNTFVEYIGKIGNTLIIVGQHPQGKPEKKQSDEILSFIKYLLNIEIVF
jgi:hypothetical protein